MRHYRRLFRREFGPLRVALSYATFGALWILLSDAIALRIITDEASLPIVQTVKGLFYIAITTVLVYALARFSTRSTTEETRLYQRLYEQDKRQLAALIAITRGGILEPRDGKIPLQGLTEMVAHALGVERVSVWRFNTDRTRLECRDLFEQSPRRHSAGHSIATADYPDYCRALAANEVISADDALRDSRTREFADSELKPHGITAMLDAPVLIHGFPEGVLCLQHTDTPRSWAHGEQTFVVSVANLISLLIVQENLRESEARFREMAENMQDVFYNYDPVHQRLLFAGRGYERIWGLPMERVLREPMSFLDSIHPEDREAVMAAHERDLAGDSTETEFRVIRPDGSVSWVVDRSSSIVNAEGVVDRIVGTMRDITDRKQAEADRQRIEERLRQMQKLEAVGQLAGGVAHDFNNMLTIIIVRAEMAIRKVDPSDPTHGSLREILDAAERSASLTRQLLTYASRQPVTPQPLSLNTFVEDALPMLNRIAGENISVAWHPGEDLWLVELDPSQIDQILVNLCLNARDALPGGGVIRLETRNVMLREEDCRTRPELAPGDHVLLSVSDTGSGMKEAVMARIFEPFFTTKEVGKGTGLGLPTVHGIMRQNRGTIEVDSAPGRGSTFRVYLPRHTATAGNAASEEEAGRETLNALPPGHGETVLVAEDDPDVRRLAVEILSSLGYSVLDVADGAAALRIAREHRGDIHLLMTDMEMPGMSGHELAKSFGEARPHAGRLFMSGKLLTQAGDVHFVRKPFATAELAIKVRAALGPRKQGN